MCADIQVAAEHHRLLLLQQFAVGEKCRIPVLVAQLHAREIFLGVGRIHRDDVELVVFRGHHAAFIPGVALQFIGEGILLREGIGKSVDRPSVAHAREDGRTRVALLLRRVPVLLVFGQVDLGLFLVRLGFLQAENVGLVFRDEFLKGALAGDGTDAIDVPRVESSFVSCLQGARPSSLRALLHRRSCAAALIVCSELRRDARCPRPPARASSASRTDKRRRR